MPPLHRGNGGRDGRRWSPVSFFFGLASLNRRPPLPMTRVMSIESTLARVSALRAALADPSTLIGSSSPLTGGSEAPAASAGASAASSFANALALASSAAQSPAGELPGGSGMPASAGSLTPSALSYSSALGVTPGLTGVGAGAATTGLGARIAAVAESQLGQAEQPPGSNESPAIAEYRSATAGAVPGEPWCAYFASWAARQAGEPIGVNGQGLGSVSEIWSWAQSSGRALVNGPGVVPKPGDLIVFGGEHVGIVRGVLPSGQIETIEGNFENKVAANLRSPGEATGYVSMS
jgi:hypothetical protein